MRYQLLSMEQKGNRHRRLGGTAGTRPGRANSIEALPVTAITGNQANNRSKQGLV